MTVLGKLECIWHWAIICHKVWIPIKLPDSWGEKIILGNWITQSTDKEPFSLFLYRDFISKEIYCLGILPHWSRGLTQDHLCRKTQEKNWCGHFCPKHILSSGGKNSSSNHLLASQGLTSLHWAVSCLANICLLTQLLQKVTAFPQRCWFACNGAPKWPSSPPVQCSLRSSPSLNPKQSIQEVRITLILLSSEQAMLFYTLRLSMLLVLYLECLPLF